MSFRRRTRLAAAGILPFLALCTALTTQAEAAMTPWQTSEGGRMRLVALSKAEAGHIAAALEIEPKIGRAHV
jgi:DsbC/DsbD-like thiol-disulfide interchange protein